MRGMRRWWSSWERPRLDFKQLDVSAAERNAVARNVKCDPRKVAVLYAEHSQARRELDTLLQQRRSNVDPNEGRRLKREAAEKAVKVEELGSELAKEAERLPNATSPQTPLGDEGQCRELHRFETGPLRRDGVDHVELLRRFGWADFAGPAMATGEGFVSLRSELAFLEMALVMLAMRRAREAGFSVQLTPDLARDEVVAGCGFRPREGGSNAASSPIYSVANEQLSLVGTAEIGLAGEWAGRIVGLNSVPWPIRVCGFSHAFRRETGQSGRESRGLYRLHQFSKVELFALSLPDQSEQTFEELVGFQRAMLEALQLPHRVLEMSSEELGMSAFRKIDCEVWMPSRGAFGEVSSASNCTDFQSRRLNIRYQIEVGSNRFVHTLNATALAVPRILIGLLENHYDAAADVVRLPACLHELMQTDAIGAKRRA